MVVHNVNDALSKWAMRAGLRGDGARKKGALSEAFLS